VFSFFSADVISAPIAVSWGQIVAIAAAILISFLNYIGIKKAGEFQLVFTLLKVAIILGIVVVCFSGLGNARGRDGATLRALLWARRAGSLDSWPPW